MRAWCSWALISTITPSYKRWSASCRSDARFSPTPFKALTMGLSASFSMVSAPSGSTIALEAFVCSILAASEVSVAKLVDTVPTYDAWVCNSCNPVWIAPSMIY